jgi:hypothetical protein
MGPQGQFFQVSIGDLGVIISLAIALWRGQKWFMNVQKWLDIHEIEHEILIREYCSRHNIAVHDLPTRKRNGY